MVMQPSGLTDKLYWRYVNHRWHCFKKASLPRFTTAHFVSLCGRLYLDRSGGQDCRRPLVEKRCGECDGREADRRGWDESGPASK